MLAEPRYVWPKAAAIHDEVLHGTASLHFLFLSYDVMATAGPETKRHSDAYPLSLAWSFPLSLLLLFSLSCALTLTHPYHGLAPVRVTLLDVFSTKEQLNGMSYFVAFGALCGLTAAVFTPMFGLPRLLRALSVDRLIGPRFLRHVSPIFCTPWPSILLCGAAVDVAATLLKAEEILRLLSIGTISLNILLALSILLLRFQVEPYHPLERRWEGPEEWHTQRDEYGAIPHRRPLQVEFVNDRSFVSSIPQDRRDPMPTHRSVTASRRLLWAFLSTSLLLGLLLRFLLAAPSPSWLHLCLIVLLTLLLLLLVLLLRQPKRSSPSKAPFRTPCIPFLPLLSISMHSILLFFVPSPHAFCLVLAWSALGLLVYVLYSRWHSTEAGPCLDPSPHDAEDLLILDDPAGCDPFCHDSDDESDLFAVQPFDDELFLSNDEEPR
ncbi:unnamed protein product [Cyprideis torosa]|uniref:Uncharacterized protein n=1 Tax=Cyprideis torosa TaxID=163714 RepID=A0A7R8WFE7_9CRUS|nr:unnamed protein product [Cyprideis torosa]CAG0896779.1 unnamed protein product [Cyprideis torosa]